MKLRLDLLEQMTDQDILEEVLANNHRYKPEPLFSKTGVGSLSSASTEERAQEVARSTARIQRAMQRLKPNGETGKESSPCSNFGHVATTISPLNGAETNPHGLKS